MKIDKYKGICLSIGCGRKKENPNFVGMDKRKLPGVDIIHDLEVFPYPLPDECCITIVGTHIIEHIKPWLIIDFMDELWRIMKLKGRLALSTPYAGSSIYWQDPTHCTGFNETSFTYFDPRFPAYKDGYRPKPWKILKGFPVWQANGMLEIVMEKVKDGNS